MSDRRFLSSAAGQVYEVFAKIKPDDPLRYVGNVVAPDVKLAQVYAFTTYQEWAWAEMIIAPRKDFIALMEVE